MSTPAEYYRSLPPVSKTYGVACLMTTSAYYLQLYDARNISLDYGPVFKSLQVWRLITNFFFLGSFSLPFAVRLIMIAKYGVSLERGPFDKRTADYVWMFIFGAFSLLVIAAVPFFWYPFMGISLVFMIVYVWSREFPNARINIYGVVSLKGFYLPWALLALDLIFGNPIKPDIVGMIAGHLYYFLTVLHPLAGGKFKFKTPLWVYPFLPRSYGHYD
ncbi:Derlin-1 isoform B [Glycine soja]|uniref:Derlin n=1 Tax=Glycine soja TaxID=3848 RepID=A0A445KGQ0_GLYSO|nr:Derlin-1 isoform B [Glycine soja]